MATPTVPFAYTIRYSRCKTLNISVERDRSVVVRAPEGLSEARIAELVAEKQRWIEEKINHAQKYPTRPGRKEFVSGETIRYLGRRYQLQVSQETFEGIRFRGRFYLSQASQPEANILFKAWYMAKAQEKLPAIVAHYAEHLGVSYRQCKVSEMQYRWGSCTPTGNLIFNWRMMQAPMSVVEYLVVHELVHLRVPHHGPEFWHIVSVQLPHYQAAKAWLRQHGALLEEQF